MQKAKELLDSRVFWATIGSIAGTLFGDKAAAIVSALGSIVQAVI